MACQDVPLALARTFHSSSPLVKGVAKAVLYCEQEGILLLPPHPSETVRSASTGDHWNVSLGRCRPGWVLPRFHGRL